MTRMVSALARFRAAGPGLVLAGVALAWPLAAGAGGADTPLSLSCPVCHGAPGAPSSVPGFYGWPAAAIAARLRQYRDGDPQATAMPRLAAALSDAEIDALAQRFAPDPDAP